MQIIYDEDGTPHVAAYARGDFVRLTRSERGGSLAGQVGDWGQVEDASGTGLLTIRIAGFSQPRGAAVSRLTGVPSRLVEPCDRRGTPTPPRAFAVRRASRPAASGARRSQPRWRAWAAMIALASCGALLVGLGVPIGAR